jgi:hypothetical protein
LSRRIRASWSHLNGTALLFSNGYASLPFVVFRYLLAV